MRQHNSLCLCYQEGTNRSRYSLKLTGSEEGLIEGLVGTGSGHRLPDAGAHLIIQTQSVNEEPYQHKVSSVFDYQMCK